MHFEEKILSTNTCHLVRKKERVNWPDFIPDLVVYYYYLFSNWKILFQLIMITQSFTIIFTIHTSFTPAIPSVFFLSGN